MVYVVIYDALLSLSENCHHSQHSASMLVP